MTRQSQPGRHEVRVVLRLPSGRVCLVRPVGADTAVWGLPGCAVGTRAAPARVAAQHCAVALGLEGLVLVPQGMRVVSRGHCPLRWHVFCADLPCDEVLPLGYAEVRWSAAGELAQVLMDAGAARVLADLNP